VTLADDGACEFRSVMRRRQIRIHRITAISSEDNAIYVHYEHGKKIHLWETDDFDDLLSHLLEINPAIELKGGF
jgi:hypothetical protein